MTECGDSDELLALSYWMIDLKNEYEVTNVELEFPDTEPPILSIHAQVQPTRIITDIVSDSRWNNRIVSCYTDETTSNTICTSISLDAVFSDALKPSVVASDGNIEDEIVVNAMD